MLCIGMHFRFQKEREVTFSIGCAKSAEPMGVDHIAQKLIQAVSRIRIEEIFCERVIYLLQLMRNRLGPPWVPLDQGLTENSDRNSAIFFAVCFLLQINWSNEMVFKHITYKNGFAICTLIVVMLTLKMYMGDFTFPWKNITLSTEHQSPSVHEILNSFSLINKDASGNSSMMDEFIARHFIFSQSSLYSLNESEIGRLLKGASNATDPQTVSI